MVSRRKHTGLQHTYRAGGGHAARRSNTLVTAKAQEEESTELATRTGFSFEVAVLAGAFAFETYSEPRDSRWERGSQGRSRKSGPLYVRRSVCPVRGWGITLDSHSCKQTRQHPSLCIYSSLCIESHTFGVDHLYNILFENECLGTSLVLSLCSGAGCDVAFKSESFTRAVYKGLLEIQLLAADELADPEAEERMLSGNGADVYATPPSSQRPSCSSNSDTQ